MTFGEEDRRVTKMAVTLASEAARLFCSASDTVDLGHHGAMGESDDRYLLDPGLRGNLPTLRLA
jgi:hypothetical protein